MVGTNKNKRKAPRGKEDEAQSSAFIEKAQELAADGDSASGDELMRRLAKTPPGKKHPKAS
jgi:hypothetical protein